MSCNDYSSIVQNLYTLYISNEDTSIDWKFLGKLRGERKRGNRCSRENIGFFRMEKATKTNKRARFMFKGEDMFTE